MAVKYDREPTDHDIMDPRIVERTKQWLEDGHGQIVLHRPFLR
jgi:hypothetical protein